MSEVNWHIGHLDHLESPWGNAGGVAKGLGEVSKLAHTGGGFIEHGSTSLEYRPDHSLNGQITYFYNPETGETFNSVRLANHGMDVVERQIPEMNDIVKAHGKRIIYNVVPVTDDPINETEELVRRAYGAGAEAVLVDVSCPTVVKNDNIEQSQQSLRNLWVLNRTLGKLATIGVGMKYPRIFVRTPPYASYDKAKTAYRIIENSRAVSAVFVSNSWRYHPLKNNEQHGLKIPEGAGVGLSGPAMAPKAALQTKWAIEIINGSGMDVVSCCGIMAAEEMAKRLKIGASACSGTTFFYENKDWKEGVDKLLYGFSEL